MVSIVLPVYNSERWLQETIESVVAQTYPEWELLIIDDGSTDDSLKIARNYESKDKRIRVIANNHGGVARARNTGLKNVSGEYITAIDSDDLMLPKTLEILMRNMKDYDADISTGKTVEFDDDDKKFLIRTFRKAEKGEKNSRKWRVKVISGEEGAKKSLYQTGILPSMCGVIIRKSLFDDLPFKEGEVYEDLNMFYRLALRARRVAVTNQTIYLYRQRQGSIMHTFNVNRLIVLQVVERMEKYIAEHHPGLKKGARSRRFAANYNMLRLISSYLAKNPEKISEEDRETFSKELARCRAYVKKEARHELTDPDVRLKNRLGALIAFVLPASMLR